jgi:hypothetical protein
MKSINYAREWKVFAAVLSLFNELERQMGLIIASYIAPMESRIDFVNKQLLHSSSIGFAGKARLVVHISKRVGGPKFNQNNFHRVMSARNALAHGHGPAAFRRNVNALAQAPYGEYLAVVSLRSDGSLEEQRSDDVTADFMRLSRILFDQLSTLHQMVRSDH